jgi:protein-tyrosine phosphatase
MIDIHTHLIPNIDDGSKSLESSIRQLQLMAAGGIKHVFCTTHYMRGLYQFDKAGYRYKFAELVEEARKQNIPITLHPGAEVFLIKGIEDDIKEKKLTLGDSSYVLVESELNGLPPDFYNNLFDLLHKGYRPILAHAERYVSIMGRTREVKELIDKGIYIQVNAGSLLGGYGAKIKTTAWKLVNKGWVHIIASDDHVRQDYEAFFQVKQKIMDHVDSRTVNLLTHDYPQMILENKKIPYTYVSVHVPRRKRKLRWLKRFFGIR